jgi:hypothetical protein
MAYGAAPSRPRKKSPGGVLPQVQQNIQQDARNRMMDILPEGGMMGGMLGAPELVLPQAGDIGNMLAGQQGNIWQQISRIPGYAPARPSGRWDWGNMMGGLGFSPMPMEDSLGQFQTPKFPPITPSYGGGGGPGFA